MKLTNAYIIDGDVIEKRIAELEEFKKIMIDAVERKELDVLKKIMHHAKPALPIVEEAFDKASVYTKHSCMELDELDEFDEVGICKFREQFLTKDF